MMRKSTTVDLRVRDAPYGRDLSPRNLLRKWVESMTLRGMGVKPSRFTEEQIIGVLREQEAGAKTVPHSISSVSPTNDLPRY